MCPLGAVSLWRAVLLSRSCRQMLALVKLSRKLSCHHLQQAAEKTDIVECARGDGHYDLAICAVTWVFWPLTFSSSSFQQTKLERRSSRQRSLASVRPSVCYTAMVGRLCECEWMLLSGRTTCHKHDGRSGQQRAVKTSDTCLELDCLSWTTLAEVDIWRADTLTSPAKLLPHRQKLYQQNAP